MNKGLIYTSFFLALGFIILVGKNYLPVPLLLALSIIVICFAAFQLFTVPFRMVFTNDGKRPKQSALKIVLYIIVISFVIAAMVLFTLNIFTM